MDAAHKLSTHFRLSLLIIVALTLSAPAWAQSPSFVLDSTTVTCSGTSCPTPNGGTVNVNSSSTPIA